MVDIYYLIKKKKILKDIECFILLILYKKNIFKMLIRILLL